MSRVDLYGTVHKGLRTRLFDTSVELARADFGAPADVGVAVAAYRRTTGFLREHHEHEAAFCDPLIASREKALVDANGAQHASIDAMLARLDAVVLEIESAEEAGARLAIGRRIVSLYDDFVAAYLAHMRHEETAMQSAFHAHCTDEELANARGRIQGSIPPARFAEWLEIMLPAMNLDERAGMIGGIKRHAPPQAFQAVADVAMRVLGKTAWSVVCARASV